MNPTDISMTSEQTEEIKIGYAGNVFQNYSTYSVEKFESKCSLYPYKLLGSRK